MARPKSRARVRSPPQTCTAWLGRLWQEVEVSIRSRLPDRRAAGRRGGLRATADRPRGGALRLLRWFWGHLAWQGGCTGTLLTHSGAAWPSTALSGPRLLSFTFPGRGAWSVRPCTLGRFLQEGAWSRLRHLDQGQSQSLSSRREVPGRRRPEAAEEGQRLGKLRAGWTVGLGCFQRRCPGAWP